jgi:hypothetical protein
VQHTLLQQVWPAVQDVVPQHTLLPAAQNGAAPLWQQICPDVHATVPQHVALSTAQNALAPYVQHFWVAVVQQTFVVVPQIVCFEVQVTAEAACRVPVLLMRTPPASAAAVSFRAWRLGIGRASIRDRSSRKKLNLC